MLESVEHLANLIPSISNYAKDEGLFNSMTTSSIITATLWGVASGYIGLQILANLLALCFCLHGLLMTRWKRLAKKVTGQIKYSINLQLILRLTLYTLVFAALLHFGDGYVRGKFWFEYRDSPAILFTAAGIITALVFVPAAIRRLRVIWRMSHEFDFAERRQRTRMLKS